MEILNKCIGCWQCIPYCPVGAIKKNETERVSYINHDECVECGVCINSGICPVQAIYQNELAWPDFLKAKWSSVVYIHPETNIQGRGTDEMKTNDVTGRFKPGFIGVGVELGRPSTGTRFEDVEKVTKALAECDVTFEKNNPLTSFINTNTGLFQEEWQGYPLNEKFRKTKVMTVIIEAIIKDYKMLEIIERLKTVSKEINTVMSVELITKCNENGEIPITQILSENEIKYYINGKTNIGLGKPKYIF